MRVLVKKHHKRLYLWDPVCKRRFSNWGPYKRHVGAKGHRNPLRNAKKTPEEEATEAMYGIEEGEDSGALKQIYGLFPSEQARRKLGIRKTGPGQYTVTVGKPDIKAPASAGEGWLPMILFLAGIGALIWWGTKQKAPEPAP